MADTYHGGDPLRVARPADDRRVGRRGQGLRATRSSSRFPTANLLAAIYPDEPAPVADATEAARAALESPVSGPRFSELIASASKVAVIIDNQFRPTPQSRLLPPVLDAIEAAGKPARHRLREREGLPDVRLGHRPEDRQGQPRAHGAARDRVPPERSAQRRRRTSTSASPRAARRSGCTRRSPRAT